MKDLRQSMPVWRTLCSIVVDLNTNVLKRFPRLKLVLYLIVQANNLDVIFWGRNNWFCSRKCLFTSLFGQVCLFCDEMAYQKKKREKATWKIWLAWFGSDPFWSQESSQIQIFLQGSSDFIWLHFIDGLIFWSTSGACIKQFPFLHTPILRRVFTCVLILYRILDFKCRMNNWVHLSLRTLNASLKTSAAKVFHCNEQVVHILSVLFAFTQICSSSPTNSWIISFLLKEV